MQRTGELEHRDFIPKWQWADSERYSPGFCCKRVLRVPTLYEFC